MSTAKQPYVRFFVSDWLGGTRGLKANEIGIYITLLALMYDRESPLPEDPRRLARQCGCTPKTFSQALEVLIEEGKIDRLKDGLWNKRVEKEFDWRAKKSEDASEAAKSRWEKTNQNNDPSMRTQCDGNADAMPFQIPDTRKDSVPNGTGGPPPDSLEAVRRDLYREGTALLMEAKGCARSTAGGLVAKWVSASGNNQSLCLATVRDCRAQSPPIIDPMSWVMARVSNKRAVAKESDDRQARETWLAKAREFDNAEEQNREVH